MSPDRATLNFLNSFSEDYRKEGERLQRDGFVTQIFGDHRKVQGRVEDRGELCRTTLQFENEEGWTGKCSCREGRKCPALVATMIERLSRGETLPESPNEFEDQTITELLEERLGRPMEPKEDAFIDKLEKRYQRFESEGELKDHDLVRLNPRWPVESYEPIQLWPTPPSNIVEFWNYIAYHFRNRNFAYPKFMEAVTDLEAVEEALSEWERQQAEEAWRQTVFGYEEPANDTADAMELRLLLTTTEARLQWREAGSDGRFMTVSDRGELGRFAKHREAGALHFDGGSALIWENFLVATEESEGVTLRLASAERAAILNRLFHTPELEGSMVNLDEKPIAVSDKAMQWVCEDADPNSDQLVLRLIDADGNQVPHSVRLLPGQPNLFLGEAEVYPGPPFWGEGTEIQPVYEIPRRVLQSESGVSFLSGISAALPETLSKRIVDQEMIPKLTLRLNQKLTGAESEQLLVEAEATDADGTRREVLEREGWIVTERSDRTDVETIFRYKRRALRPIPDLIEPLNLTWEVGRRCFRTRVTRTFPEKFVEWCERLPEGLDVDFDEHLQSLRADPVKASVTFDIVASEIDWFDLKIAVDVEGLNLTMDEVRALVAARGGFVRMKGGGWLRLAFDLTEEQTRAVSRLGLDPFDLTGESHRMHVLQLAEPLAKEVFDAAAWEQICKRSAELKLRVSPKVPADLKLELRPYQIEGFHFLAYLSTNGFGGILADDMGLGKTVQAITWLLWLRENETRQRPALVVCPKSVLDVWAGEVRKFSPDLRVQILRAKGDLDMDVVREGVDVLVLNYSQLRVNGEHLMKQRWLAVILDEGQQIKNPDSKAAKAARQLESDNRLVLTGTPIENRLLDIWSLMGFAMPGVLGNRKYFRDRFDRRKDPLCQERLSARLRPFLLRRTKGQVAVDLPPRTEEDVLCKMEKTQEQLYKDELARIQSVVLKADDDEKFNRARFTVLQGLTRLRQICCHPALINPDQPEAESAKFTALFYLLDQLQEEGHKVLVFSQFVTMLKLIEKRLIDEKRHYTMLTGQTRDRQAVIEEFQTSEEPTVFLLSLKAGGSGLNLTAASYVILYDPWWNPAVENQAIDRTHRIGQTNKVIAYRLLMRDSVEEKIRVLQKQKEAAATGVLGEEGFAKSLSRTDLKFLFDGPGQPTLNLLDGESEDGDDDEEEDEDE
ncbi:MAG: hypothetical protein ACI8UO_001430 [Verrucomicrobiales bacterium]|jgi:hypothetical protein